MPYGYQSVPFWDFVRSMDAADRSGAGIDQPAFGFQHFGPPPTSPPPFAFGFGPGPFGPHHRFGGPGGCARGGGHCRRPDGSHEKHPHCKKPDSPEEKQHGGEEKQPEEPTDTPRDRNAEEGHPHGPRHWRGRHGHGPWGRRGGPPRGFGGSADANFDLSALIDAFASHPIAQALRTYAEEAGIGGEGLTKETDAENTFTPPIDIFSTPSSYVLHVALPGAKKEDVGVNWDAEKNELNVAGVVYRQGDEEFLKSISKTERKVGVFERSVKLPPGEEDKEEVEGDAITAKLEDGVLIVTVPKVEKEWTEIKKVDIE